MEWDGAKVTRRTILAGFGASVVDRAVAEDGLIVSTTEDGGFVVRINFHEAWRVKYSDIKNAWNAEPAIIDADVEAQIVVLKGLLLGKSAKLELSFRRVVGRWECACILSLKDLGIFKSVSAFPFVQSSNSTIFSIPVQAAQWGQSVGLPSGAEMLRPCLELDRTLKPVLTGPFRFTNLRGFTVRGLLEFPANKSILSVLKFGPSDSLNLAAGWSLDADGMHSDFPISKPDYLVIKGEGLLRIGRTKFRANEESFVRFQNSSLGTSWSTQWCLPTHEQAIETPHGRFNVAGTGDSNINANGVLGTVQGFSASAQLCHAALRLPLTSTGSRYADVGRLDFDASKNSQINFVLANFRKTAQRSWISLDAGDSAPVRIQLDGARLHVAREADMFHGRFRFTGVALTMGRKSPQLVRSVIESKEQCLLRIDLPPQHIREQSFARQLPVLPGRDLDSNEFPMMLEVNARTKLRDILGQSKLSKDGQDKEFVEFANLYEKEFEKYESKEVPKLDSLKELENIYVGRQGLFSLASRRVANELAYEIRSKRKIELDDVRLGVGLGVIADTLHRRRPVGEWNKEAALDVLQDLLAEAENRSDDHVVIQKEYRRNNPNIATRFFSKAWLEKWPKEFPDSSTQLELSKVLRAVDSALAPGEVDTKKIKDALEKAYRDEELVIPVQRKAAGATRLVFDMGAEPKGGWPYSLETLFRWKEFDLKVTQRAMRFDVELNAEANSTKTDTERLKDALKTQKILPSDTIEERMRLVLAQAQLGPCDFDTSIEVPARLYLSPAGDARFLPTPSPSDGADRVPIWQARMQEVPGKRFTLRAVGSPDFKAGIFKSSGRTKDDQAPLRGVYDFRSTLDGFDRHQLVALSSVYGLPVLARRSPDGFEQTSQLSPPEGYRLRDVLEGDRNEQALYIPRPLTTRLLSLSPLGACLDLNTFFVPPASVRNLQGENLFNAFSVERWRSQISFGRDVTTEIVYKGFLYPIGFRATLVKITERVFAPWQEQKSSPILPVAFLRQRLFIQISDLTKKFRAVNHPYEGRGWPAQSMTMDVDRTPDLLDPVSKGDSRSSDETWILQSNGRLDHKFRVGLVFWPRTTPGEGGNIWFRMKIDQRPELASMPLIFVDNEAVHDTRTMRLLRRYYNNEVPSRLKLINHGGVRRRYAPEKKPGDTTFETVEWRVGADSRDRRGLDGADPDDSQFLMDSAMESDDQPPVYPRLRSALIRHDASSRFTGNVQKPTEVEFYQPYLESGFAEEVGSDSPDRDLGKHTFLVVTDEKPQQLQMGKNGDRSGGVGRPDLPIRAIGRHGPIGGAEKWKVDYRPRFDKQFKFFSDEAKVLGLVRLNEIVERAIKENEAVPPLLRDTLEFGCDVVYKGARKTSEALQKVIENIDRLGSPLGEAYADLRISLEQLNKVLTSLAKEESSTSARCNLPAMVEQVSQAIAMSRNLIDTIDRLASSPLAPLTKIVDSKLRDAVNDLWIKVRAALEDRLAQLSKEIRLDAISEFLLPIGQALALIDRFTILAGIQQRLAQAIEASTAAVFAIDPPPPTLEGLRRRWIEKLGSELDKLISPGIPDIKKAIVELTKILQNLNERPPPDVLEQIYVCAVALRAAPKDMSLSVITNLLGEQRAKITQELLFWWRRTTSPNCEDILQGLRALRLMLLAQDLDQNICDSPQLCVAGTNPPSAPPPGLCLLLWRLCQDLPALSPASTDLAKAYMGLAISAAAIEPDLQLVCTNPTDIDGIRRSLTRALFRINAARSEYIEKLKSWAETLTSVAFDRIGDEAARRVGDAAAKALSVLIPAPTQVNEFVQKLTPLTDQLTAQNLRDQFESAIGIWNDQANRLRSVQTRDNLRVAADDLAKAAPELARQAIAIAEVAVTQSVLRAALPEIAVADRLVEQLLDKLDLGYREVIGVRNQTRENLKNLQRQLELIGVKLTGGLLADAVRVEIDDQLGTVCVLGSAQNQADGSYDGLDHEAAVIQCIKGLPVGLARVTALMGLLATWRRRDPALIRLVNGLPARAKQVLALPAQLTFLSVDELREKLDTLLRDTIPTKRHLVYDLKFPLDEKEINIGGGLAKFVTPNMLSLSASTDIDLLSPTKSPKFEVKGRLNEFKVKILEDAVILHFKPFDFSAGSSSSAHFSAELDYVEIGGMLVFLTLLAAYFKAESGSAGESSGGSSSGTGHLLDGPYVIPRTAGPGIKAGYRINIGAAQIGNLAILGLNFDAHCEMPFDDAKGAVRVSLASPEAPFLITCAPYGGRGHLVMETGADDRGVKLDIGFQWGGAAAISFGPLQGSAFIMIGFRVIKLGDSFDFRGFFIAAFEGHVACFGVAGSFVVTLLKDGERMRGEATLSFEFSCGPVTVKYQVTAAHDAGSNIGEQAWLEPTPLLDQTRVIPAGLGLAPSAVAVSRVPALLENWALYQARYDLRVRAVGRRKRQ